jgi:hypothetical protein
MRGTLRVARKVLLLPYPFLEQVRDYLYSSRRVSVRGNVVVLCQSAQLARALLVPRKVTSRPRSLTSGHPPPSSAALETGDLLRAICSCHLRDLNCLDRNRIANEILQRRERAPFQAILVCIRAHLRHADAGVGLSRSDDGQITAHVDQ